jgi:hypothetical protein
MENNSLQRYTGYVSGMCWASFADINKLTNIMIFLTGQKYEASACGYTVSDDGAIHE